MGLPKWTTSEELTVAAEAAEYAGLSPEARLALLDKLCSDVPLMLAAHGDAEGILKHRDPLPESSRRLLAKLRARHRAARDARG